MKIDYQQRSNHYKDLEAKESSRLGKLGKIRAGVFLIGVTLTFHFFNGGPNWTLISAGFLLMTFIALVLKYQAYQFQKALYHELELINQEEVCREKLELSGLDTGEKYAVANHNYHDDLDVFGEHSIFQLVNRCALPSSEGLLAQWLSAPAADPLTIRDRQVAGRELAEQLEWCQMLSAHTRLALKKKKKNAPSLTGEEIIHWVQSNNKIAISKWIPWILNGFTVALLIAALFTMLPFQVLYLAVLFNGLYLGINIKKLNKVIAGIDQAHFMIKSYAQSIKQVEQANFESNKLLQLQKTLQTPFKASKAINELSSLTQRIDGRANMLYVILDILLVTDGHLLMSLIKWRKKYSEHIERWLNAIHELECLASLGGFTRTNPNFVFPRISDEMKLTGTSIGHPLIPENARINNDYNIAGQGAIHIITGSNMSGKSTFERTLGVNLILAYLGAPVNATDFEAGIFTVFTSMRTRDNLEENTSSFYAELKRLKQLLQLVEENKPVFFLLDEILKGTNSEDRHKGAVALVHKLIRSSGMGLVSTHDIELGQLAKDLEQVSNFSFNSTIDGDQIRFDYRLTNGVCNSFNASQLMKNMGITD
jgi:DNA mismatch repair ATPase MutS